MEETKELAVKNDVQSLLSSEDVSNRLKDILGNRASTFATSVIQISNQNTMLSQCVPASIVGAAMTSATLDLPLNNSLGFAYIVPFNEKQKDGSYLKKAQFQIGYKGLKQLAIRSGQYLSLYAKEVYEGQLVDDDTFLGYHFDWKNKKSDKIIGYASYFKLINGFESTFYMTAEEMEEHAKKYSQTYKKGYGLWKDDKEKMSKKTVTKLHLNSGEAPLSIEMQKAVITDQATINDIEGNDITYIDNTEDRTVETEAGPVTIQDKKVVKSVAAIQESISKVSSPDVKEVEPNKEVEVLPENMETTELKDYVTKRGIEIPSGVKRVTKPYLLRLLDEHEAPEVEAHSEPEQVGEDKKEAPTAPPPLPSQERKEDDSYITKARNIALKLLETSDVTGDNLKNATNKINTGTLEEVTGVISYLEKHQVNKTSSDLVSKFKTSIEDVFDGKRPFNEQNRVREAFKSVGITNDTLESIVAMSKIAEDGNNLVNFSSKDDLVKVVEIYEDSL